MASKPKPRLPPAAFARPQSDLESLLCLGLEVVQGSSRAEPSITKSESLIRSEHTQASGVQPGGLTGCSAYG